MRSQFFLFGREALKLNEMIMGSQLEREVDHGISLIGNYQRCDDQDTGTVARRSLIQAEDGVMVVGGPCFLDEHIPAPTPRCLQSIWLSSSLITMISCTSPAISTLLTLSLTETQTLSQKGTQKFPRATALCAAIETPMPPTLYLETLYSQEQWPLYQILLQNGKLLLFRAIPVFSRSRLAITEVKRDLRAQVWVLNEEKKWVEAIKVDLKPSPLILPYLIPPLLAADTLIANSLNTIIMIGIKSGIVKVVSDCNGKYQGRSRMVRTVPRI
ncbi:hypothetical protein AMTR_s00029p00216670 [Amborella trichopoda]|uniref:Uncharacterized protein n=1 Tax=Amborella trichopoda TaxID=13333 RepID=W1PR50_AMBTC|nr:hypothetical protein AMTR_s00029p00216670 [Amborella trichopoda]